MTDYKKLVELNIDEIEPVEVSVFEEQRVKQYIMGRKKKTNVFKYIAIVASITIGATIATSFAVPSLASQIPIFNNIMSYFSDENSYNSNFTDVATDISQVKSSNGVSIIIEDAVYDGSSITVSYAIETDKDLGLNPRTSAMFDVQGAEGMGSTGTIEKVNETTYVGTEKITPIFNGSKPDTIEISWEPDAFVITETNESIIGDWQFAFELPALVNKKELVNQSVTNNGVTVKINSYETNDLSTVIHYEQTVEKHVLEEWPEVTVEIINVQDDLGNKYSVDGNGGTSRDNGLSFKWSSTIKSIDPNAKSITIIPVIYFSFGSGKGLEKKEMDPIRIDLK
ncbi:DUF4179 domain-containing protein [Psychrobacillus sp. FSL H8-0484]|uniref:DUF4179 domain-containing protein n=1 Tax=Psychrobacillus sp. FSL H8-0484 TaxID=2921390 RepID=UPI0030FA0EC8